eukprot:jgi/Ulvmu1/12821/UM098_0002.1
MQAPAPAPAAIRQAPFRARYALLCVGLIGELVMGGLMFGWNALSVVLKQEAVFTTGCDPQSSSCSRQDSKLNVVWTAGVFAVNFGVAFAGLSVDYVGPKLTSSAGATMTSVGLIALGFGVKWNTMLAVGAFLSGLGGLCFHMSQFHVSQLFPENKGFISSLYVGFFIASGVTFEVLRAVYAALVTDNESSHSTYRAILVGHACVCLPWAALMLWMNPRMSLKRGQTYSFDMSRFRFVVSSQEPADQTGRTFWLSSDSSLCPDNTVSSNSKETKQPESAAGVTVDNTSNAAPCVSEVELQSQPNPDPMRGVPARRSICGERRSSPTDRRWPMPGHDRLQADVAVNGDRSIPLPSGDAGQPSRPANRLRRRWAALASKSIWQQLKSPECVALGLVFSGNVYALQLYLGTARIQLEEMGDGDEKYLQMLSFIVPGVFVFAPFSGFLLDRLGFGFVLLLINTLSLATAILQSIMVLPLQVLNFFVWALARYLLYSTFFTAVGTLFTYQSFGRVTAVISVIQALTGLTQLPLTDFAIEDLEKEFLYLHVGEIVLVTLLFIPVIQMFRWERMG